MVFRRLFSLFSKDLAIDLGTANTLVYAEGKGIVVREPSIVAINEVTNKVEAVGSAAKEMLGRTPGNIKAIRPMKDGVIADFEITERMLDYFIKKAHGRSSLVRPKIVISVPSGVTQVEKRAVKDSALQAGASEVFIIEHIQKSYNLLIGERTAEQIKMQIGSAFPLDEPEQMEIRGRDLQKGLPKAIRITDAEVREALAKTVNVIVAAVRKALRMIPPELSADLTEKGIILTGGGSLLRNLDVRLREETDLPVTIAEKPLDSVAVGTGQMLKDIDLLRKISLD